MKFEKENFSLDMVGENIWKGESHKETTPNKNYYPKLDLHGSILADAYTKVDNFISECTANKRKKALIVTGQGHNSKNKATLKPHIRSYLEKSSRIKRCRRAPLKLGGLGAFLIEIN